MRTKITRSHQLIIMKLLLPFKIGLLYSNKHTNTHLHTSMAYVMSDSRVANTTNKNSEYMDRPRSELTELELQKLEEFEFANGPMALLQNAVTNSTPVVISCRNNHKLIGRVKAFDRHCNMVLENVKELWTESVRNSKGQQIKLLPKERFVSKMFLRGDSVIVVLKT